MNEIPQQVNAYTVCLSTIVRWNSSLHASWTSRYKNIRKCLQNYVLVQINYSVSAPKNLRLSGFCATWCCHSIPKGLIVTFMEDVFPFYQ